MSNYLEHQEFCDNATEKYIVDLSNDQCRQLIRDNGLTLTNNDTCPDCLKPYRDDATGNTSGEGGE